MILLRLSPDILLCLLLFVSISYAKVSMSFDSLAGVVVEIQRTGAVKWEYTPKESKLFNNDQARIPVRGIAILKWQGLIPNHLRNLLYYYVALF